MYDNALLLESALLADEKSELGSDYIEAFAYDGKLKTAVLFCGSCGLQKDPLQKVTAVKKNEIRFCSSCGQSNFVEDFRFSLLQYFYKNERRYQKLLDTGLDMYFRPLIQEIEIMASSSLPLMSGSDSASKLPFANYSIMSKAAVAYFSLEQPASIHEEFLLVFKELLVNYNSDTCFGGIFIKLMQIISFLYDEYQEKVAHSTHLFRKDCFFPFFQKQFESRLFNPEISIEYSEEHFGTLEPTQNVDFYLNLPLYRIREYTYIFQSYLNLVSVSHPDFPGMFKAINIITPLDERLRKQYPEFYHVPLSYLEKRETEENSGISSFEKIGASINNLLSTVKISTPNLKSSFNSRSTFNKDDSKSDSSLKSTPLRFSVRPSMSEGTKLQQKACKKCSGQVDIEFAFCVFCGNKFKNPLMQLSK